jgi:hypothetical protein
MRHRVSRPLALPALPTALRVISGLSEAAFKALQRATRDPEAFQTLPNRIRELSVQLTGGDEDTTADVLRSLQYLYDLVHEQGDSDPRSSVPTVHARLRAFLHTTGLYNLLGDKSDLALSRLLELLQRNEAIEATKKRYRLQTSILDNAASFASFLDLRPNFSEDRTQVTEFVPIVIFQVVVEDDAGSTNSYSFQMTELGLAKLKDAVEDAARKLERIKRGDTLSKPLVNTNGRLS